MVGTSARRYPPAESPHQTKKANGAQIATKNQTQTQGQNKTAPKQSIINNNAGTVEVLFAFGPRPVSTLDAQTNIKAHLGQGLTQDSIKYTMAKWAGKNVIKVTVPANWEHKLGLYKEGAVRT